MWPTFNLSTYVVAFVACITLNYYYEYHSENSQFPPNNKISNDKKLSEKCTISDYFTTEDLATSSHFGKCFGDLDT